MSAFGDAYKAIESVILLRSRVENLERALDKCDGEMIRLSDMPAEFENQGDSSSSASIARKLSNGRLLDSLILGKVGICLLAETR